MNAPTRNRTFYATDALTLQDIAHIVSSLHESLVPLARIMRQRCMTCSTAATMTQCMPMETLAATQVGDKMRLVKLFAGTKLFGAKMINAALGADSTVSLGYELVDGTAGGGAAALLAATSTVTAGKTESGMAPLLVLPDFYITATVGQ